MLGPVPGVFGSLQALEALKFLLGLPGLGSQRDADLRSRHAEHAAPARAARAGLRGASRRAGARAAAAAHEDLEVQFGSLAEAQCRGLHARRRARRARARRRSRCRSRRAAPADVQTTDRRGEPRSRRRATCWSAPPANAARAAADLLRSQGFRECRSLRGGLKGLKVIRLKRAADAFVARVCSLLLPGMPERGRRRSSAARAGARTRRPRASPTARDARRVRRRARPNTQLEQAHAPADAECARSLGAPRFADLHARAGAARAGDGDFAGAAAAYRRAHACRPRDADILAALAGVLFDARDYAGARAAINASLAIDPRSVSTNRLAGNIDFVDERWADAIARFRYVAASDRGSHPGRIRPAHVLAGADARRRRRSPSSSRARPAKAGRSRCCSTCAANTPKRSSSRPSRPATTATTTSPTPAPTSGCARRCSTSARRTGRAASPRWRATTSRRW